MLAPGRILIHDNIWKKLEFLNIFENSKPKSQQSQTKASVSKTPNKIEFSKIFEEKQPSKYLLTYSFSLKGLVTPGYETLIN